MCGFIVNHNHGSHDMNPCHVTLTDLRYENKVLGPVGLSLSFWQHLALAAIAVQAVSVADVLADTLIRQFGVSRNAAVDQRVQVLVLQVLVLQYRLCVQVSSASGLELHNTDYSVHCTVTDASK